MKHKEVVTRSKTINPRDAAARIKGLVVDQTSWIDVWTKIVARHARSELHAQNVLSRETALGLQ